MAATDDEGAASPDDWATLTTACKAAVRQALAAEQLGLCAYCMRRIDGTRGARDDDPQAGGMRVEHWAPRSEDALQTLVWSNLLGVCGGILMTLRARRREVWRSQGEKLRRDDSLGTLRRMLYIARTPGSDGRLPPFAPVIEYYATRKLRQRGVKT